MAVCQVCQNIFDNVDGACPHCGTEYGGGADARPHEDLYGEAMTRIRAGQVADAKGLLMAAIKQDEKNGEYYFYLGSSHYKLGEFRKAYEAWQKADRYMPHVDRIHKCLVAARQQMAKEELKKRNR
jgi:cytochrome c-type biogenesis protein CcmH/NrfG